MIQKNLLSLFSALALGIALAPQLLLADTRTPNEVMEKIVAQLNEATSKIGVTEHGDSCQVTLGEDWITVYRVKPSQYRDVSDRSTFTYDPKYYTYQITDEKEKLALEYHDIGSFEVRISDWNSVALTFSNGDLASVTVRSNISVNGRSGGEITCSFE